jgi:hypothetical protein
MAAVEVFCQKLVEELTAAKVATLPIMLSGPATVTSGRTSLTNHVPGRGWLLSPRWVLDESAHVRAGQLASVARLDRGVDKEGRHGPRIVVDDPDPMMIFDDTLVPIHFRGTPHDDGSTNASAMDARETLHQGVIWLLAVAEQYPEWWAAPRSSS